MKINIILLCVSVVLLISTLLVGTAYPAQTHEHVEYPESTPPNHSTNIPGDSSNNTTLKPPIQLPSLNLAETLYGPYYIIASNSSSIPLSVLTVNEQGEYNSNIPLIMLSNGMIELSGNNATASTWTLDENTHALDVPNGLKCMQDAFQFIRYASAYEDENQPVVWSMDIETFTLTVQQGSCYIQFRRFASIDEYASYMKDYTQDNRITYPDTLTPTNN